MFLPIISALLAILSFPPFALWPFGFVALAPLFIFLLREKKFWRIVLGSFIFQLIFEIGLAYFAFDPFIFLTSAILFLGFPIVFYFFKKVINSDLDTINRIGGRYLPRWNTRLLLFALPIFWTFWDLLLARYSFLPRYILIIGNALGDSPFLGLARFGGILGLTFFAVFSNACFALLYMVWGKSRVIHRKLLFNLYCILLFLIIALLISQYELAKAREAYQGDLRELRVAAVSTIKEWALRPSAVITYMHFTDGVSYMREMLKPIRDELIFRKSEGQEFDLIIFPEKMIEEESETILPEAKDMFGIQNQGAVIAGYEQFAKDVHSAVAATLITRQNGIHYITTILINSEGELIDISNKSNLTIASEYWPFGSWRPFYYDWLRDFGPALGDKDAVFNPDYEYGRGAKKVLALPEAPFASLICGEAHYPYDVRLFKNLGAEFISHTTSNTWVRYGLKTYNGFTMNLRKIESVWLNVPIIINGRYEKAGIITPDGTADLVDFQSAGKNFGIWRGVVRY